MYARAAPNYVARGSRNLIGPFHGPLGKDDGDTDSPPCEISSNPRQASSPAICLMRGISGRQSSGNSALATSDGQALESKPRWATTANSAVSMSKSLGCLRRLPRQSFQSPHTSPSAAVPRQMRFWHARLPRGQTLRQTARWHRW